MKSSSSKTESSKDDTQQQQSQQTQQSQQQQQARRRRYHYVPPSPLVVYFFCLLMFVGLILRWDSRVLPHHYQYQQYQQQQQQQQHNQKQQNLRSHQDDEYDEYEYKDEYKDESKNENAYRNANAKANEDEDEDDHHDTENTNILGGEKIGIRYDHHHEHDEHEHDDHDHDEHDLLKALRIPTYRSCCRMDDRSGPNDYERVCFTEEACYDVRHHTKPLYPYVNDDQRDRIYAPWDPEHPLRRSQHRRKCDHINDRVLTPPMPPRWCSPYDPNDQSDQSKNEGGHHHHDDHHDDDHHDHDESDRSNITFPFGCSSYSMGARSGPYDRVLLFPYGHLAFCGIPKAGITQWMHLLRFIIGAGDYQSVPYAKPDVVHFYFDRLSPSIQDAIWNGIPIPSSSYTSSTSSSSSNSAEQPQRHRRPRRRRRRPQKKTPSLEVSNVTSSSTSTTSSRSDKWYKAVFLREPAERLLSAYLDKVARQENITFEAFVRSPRVSNLTWNTADPHWRPQSWSCHLSENIADFDFVGMLNDPNHNGIATTGYDDDDDDIRRDDGTNVAARNAKALLMNVGLWDTFGRHYRLSPPNETRGPIEAREPPPPLRPGETAWGFLQDKPPPAITDDHHHDDDDDDGSISGSISGSGGRSKNKVLLDRHHRNSRSKFWRYYRSRELLDRVREIYWMDFQLWEALQKAVEIRRSKARRKRRRKKTTTTSTTTTTTTGRRANEDDKKEDGDVDDGKDRHHDDDEDEDDENVLRYGMRRRHDDEDDDGHHDDDDDDEDDDDDDENEDEWVGWVSGADVARLLNPDRCGHTHPKRRRRRKR